MRASCWVFLLASSLGCGFGGGGTAAAPGSTVAPVSTASPTGPPALVRAVIETDGLTLASAGVGQQLTLTGVFSDGHPRDLTRAATWTFLDPAVAVVDSAGIAWARAAGDTRIQASVMGVVATGTLHVTAGAVAPVFTASTPVVSAPTWVNDVRPLLESTLNCRQCHLHPKGRFKMTLDGDVDYVFITRHGYLETQAPTLSRLLLKATNQIVHGGGQALLMTDSAVPLLESWIAAGAPYDSAGGAPPLTETTAVAALPFPNALVATPMSRNLVDRAAQQQLVVLAWWKAGDLVADVTRSAEISVSDPSVGTIDSSGLVSAQGSGIVQLTASWAGLEVTASYAFDPAAPLADGDAVNQIVLVPGAPPIERSLRASSASTSTSGTTGSPSFAKDVDPLFYGTLGCGNCHTTLGVAFKLFNSAGTDFTQITKNGLLDARNAAASLLLTKPVNADGSHPGGKVLDPSSAAYRTILAWITSGAQP